MAARGPGHACRDGFKTYYAPRRTAAYLETSHLRYLQWIGCITVLFRKIRRILFGNGNSDDKRSRWGRSSRATPRRTNGIRTSCNGVSRAREYDVAWLWRVLHYQYTFSYRPRIFLYGNCKEHIRESPVFSPRRDPDNRNVCVSDCCLRCRFNFQRSKANPRERCST